MMEGPIFLRSVVKDTEWNSSLPYAKLHRKNFLWVVCAGNRLSALRFWDESDQLVEIHHDRSIRENILII